MTTFGMILAAVTLIGGTCFVSVELGSLLSSHLDQYITQHYCS